jgi:hypothetical protein
MPYYKKKKSTGAFKKSITRPSKSCYHKRTIDIVDNNKR